MELDGLVNLGWREALIAVVVLLGVYLVLVMLRMRRLKARAGSDAPPAARGEAPAVQVAIGAYAAQQIPEAAPAPVPPAPAPSVIPVAAPEPLAAPSELPFPWNEPPPDYPGLARIEKLERDLSVVRRQMIALRDDVQRLFEEQAVQTSVPEPPLVAVTEAMSPMYSDAMQMAIQGLDASAISQHCGISRAEADLVVALVRRGDAALE